jgi:hypothetical protein
MRGKRAAWPAGLMVVLSAIAALAFAGHAAAAMPISGKVTDQSARPLEGIEVCAVPFVWDNDEFCAQTDAAGEYTILGAGPGYQIHFYDPDGVAPSYAPQWYPGVPHAEGSDEVTEAQIDAGIDAVMGPGAEIRGKVVSRVDEEPVGGIKVCPEEVVLRVDQKPTCDVTGTDGEFVVSDLGAGSYRVLFEPAEGLNFVTDAFPGPTLSAGSVFEMEAFLVPGVEFEGHLTDGSTGLPLEPSSGSGPAPKICAIETWVERALKCVSVGPGGEWKLAGLREGVYVISFSADEKEEGVDIDPDGYVRQYYDDKRTPEEALHFLAERGTVETGLDATLVRGEEIWPEEEAEEAPPSEPIDEEIFVPGGAVTGGGSNSVVSPWPGGFPAVPGPPPLLTPPPRRTVLPDYSCKKGLHRVAKGGQSRCVKFKKKPKKHHAKKSTRVKGRAGGGGG